MNVRARTLNPIAAASVMAARQNLLWQNLPPTHKLPDAAAVARLRDLVRSPAVKSALLHSNDTFLAFVLRAVEFVLADQIALIARSSIISGTFLTIRN
jgi:hypothetical protein